MITQQWTHPSSFTPFDLTPADLNGKVWLSSEGIEGMGMPEFDEFTREAPLLDGQSLQGWRAKPREVFWPVVIDAMKSTEFGWNALQSAFWKSMRPGVSGVWRVTGPSGYRELTCRFRNDGGAKYGIDPTQRKIEKHGVTLIADDPWWRGPEVSQTLSRSRMNLVRNPSGRRSLTGYTGGGGTLGLAAGSYTYLLSSVAGLSGSKMLSAANLVVGVDLLPNTQYTMSMIARQQYQPVAPIVYVAGAGVAGGQVVVTGSADDVPRRISSTFTTTSSGAVGVTMYNGAAVAAGNYVIGFSDLQIEVGAVATEYFDGYSVPRVGYSNSWTGTPDNSYSVEAPNVSLTNPGDVTVWPKYRLNGPVSAFRVTPYGGLASQGVGGSIAVAAGEHLIVDTNPTVQTAMLSSGGGTTYTDVTSQLTAVGFFPFEPGGGAYASQVSIIGGGSLVTSIIPGYYRAF